MSTPGLDERDRAILDLEKRAHWLPGEKEAEVRARFDLSATAYYQVLNRLLKSQAALAYDPHTVNRLRRVRARFLRTRTRHRQAE